MFVELPTVGTEVKQGGERVPSRGPADTYRPSADQIGAVESVKAASDIVSPSAVVLSPYINQHCASMRLSLARSRLLTRS